MRALYLSWKVLLAPDKILTEEVILDILSYVNILSCPMSLVPCAQGSTCVGDKHRDP